MSGNVRGMEYSTSDLFDAVGEVMDRDTQDRLRTELEYADILEYPHKFCKSPEKPSLNLDKLPGGIECLRLSRGR